MSLPEVLVYEVDRLTLTFEVHEADTVKVDVLELAYAQSPIPLDDQLYEAEFAVTPLSVMTGPEKLNSVDAEIGASVKYVLLSE
jgi:hypothetical protein